MAYNQNQVRAFLTASELDLFVSSLGEGIKALGDDDLRRRLKQARTLRDKSRDLLQRQMLDTRVRTGSKAGVSGEANRRTAQKAAALAETVKRYETQADLRALAEQPPSQKKSSAKPEVRAARARPAAVVLREALTKKRGSQAVQLVAAKQATGSKKRTLAAEESDAGGVKRPGPSSHARLVASRLAQSNLASIQGHTSTQVRRSQAKRDAKG